MVGSSILPACIHKGKLYFLFGRENSLADTPGWSDFGGGVDPGENIYQSACREGGEELTGFLGGPSDVNKLLKKHLRLKSREGEYYIHVFNMPYSDELVTYYNNNHTYLWQRMNKRMLNNTKMFEKIEIQWFSLSQLRKKRNSFRNFYRKIVDMLLDEAPKIKAFLSGRTKKTIAKKTGTRKNK
jgi:hypothetical protein